MRFHRGPVLLAVAVIGLAGCTSGNDHPQQPAVGQSPATSAPITPSPADTVTPTTSPTTSAPAAPQNGFLPTDQVPGLNTKWHWQDGTSSLGGGKPFGICAKADLGSIGAVKVRERTYFPPDDSDDSAAQQIAGFADPKSAAQAWSVLEAWRGRCATTIGAALGPTIGSETSIPVPGGSTARWYQVSWTPAGEETARFEAFGMIKHGALITVLRITNSGRGDSYPVGKEPMTVMVKRAGQRVAAGFGGGRL